MCCSLSHVLAVLLIRFSFFLLDLFCVCLVALQVHILGHREAVSCVLCLRVVWISHKHVDHAMGLLRLLEVRSARGDVVPQLLVVVPRQIAQWLRETTAQRPALARTALLVSFEEFRRCHQR